MHPNIAAQLHHELIQFDDLVVFIDKINILPGADWRKDIEQAINDCDYFLACLSPEFLESEWCQKELNEAETKKNVKLQRGSNNS